MSLCWACFIFLALFLIFFLFVFCLSVFLAACLFVCLLAYLPVLVFNLSVCHLPAAPICHVCAAAQENITPTQSRSNHSTNVLLCLFSLLTNFTSLLKYGLSIKQRTYENIFDLLVTPDVISAPAQEGDWNQHSKMEAVFAANFVEPQ